MDYRATPKEALAGSHNAWYFTPLDDVLDKEESHLRKVVNNISATQPDIVVVEKAVSRAAQDMFLEKNITLLLNVKPRVLKILSRVCPSITPF